MSSKKKLEPLNKVQAVSRRQYRMMMAILHGKAYDGPRGRPPKSVAAKYTEPSSDAPETKHKDTGGTWGEAHHKRAKEKTKAARIERKKSKKQLKKAFEDFCKMQKADLPNKAAATLVMDSDNKILLGMHREGKLAFPGGHCDTNEGFEQAALRELHEEAGVVGRTTTEIYRDTHDGHETVVFLAEIVSGKPKNTDEITDWKWYAIEDIPWEKLRDCCLKPLEAFIGKRFGKSLMGMVALEKLEKNIIRQKGDAVLEVTHGDALKLVGNGVFRLLNNIVKSMQDEEFKDVQIDTYTLSIRRHMNDIYSGRVSDGHKVVYQFTNKSLPELTAALMSVFEWYLPEDESTLDILDDSVLSDDAISGGLTHLMDNYKRHNIGNIYQEMETIREQMRNGVAVDLQQVEMRLMKLFDKLEETVHSMAEKHNKLAEDAGKEVDELELKLRELQQKIEDISRKPKTVEAYSSNPANKDKIHDQYYSYLTKPRIDILPNGRITISFSEDWQDMEKENFLKDLRAKVIKKAGK